MGVVGVGPWLGAHSASRLQIFPGKHMGNKTCPLHEPHQVDTWCQTFYHTLNLQSYSTCIMTDRPQITMNVQFMEFTCIADSIVALRRMHDPIV